MRILVGLVFIASAILKYLSIDEFDLYIYDHNLFSISVTETLTRLLITAECLLGIMLMFNILARFVYYTTLTFLIGFTMYLFLLPYLFNVDITNCYCFGDSMVFSRWVENPFQIDPLPPLQTDPHSPGQTDPRLPK